MSFWRPILRGMASAFDPMAAWRPYVASRRRPGETGAQADARALASDWRAVGDDLRAVMDRMDRHIAEGRRTIRRR